MEGEGIVDSISVGEGGLDVTVTDNDSVGVGGGGDFDTGVCSPLGDIDG